MWMKTPVCLVVLLLFWCRVVIISITRMRRGLRWLMFCNQKVSLIAFNGEWRKREWAVDENEKTDVIYRTVFSVNSAQITAPSTNPSSTLFLRFPCHLHQQSPPTTAIERLLAVHLLVLLLVRLLLLLSSSCSYWIDDKVLTEWRFT